MRYVVPLFLRLTDGRMQIAKLALDLIAESPKFSFKHLFENGISLDQHYFDRLKTAFPRGDGLWRTGIPRRILEVVAASRVPLSTDELKFAIQCLFPGTKDDEFAIAFSRLASFFAQSSSSSLQIVCFQHKTVADWINKSNQACMALYPDYQFESGLRDAYTALATMMLLCMNRHTRSEVPQEFRHDLATRLLLLSGSAVARFLRIDVPSVAFTNQSLDLLLLYLNEATVHDLQVRSSLLVRSGAISWLRTMAKEETRNSATKFLKEAIEWDCAELVRCSVTDLGAKLSARLPDSGELPLTLAASLGRDKVVQVLITMQADCTAVNADKLTAVHCAVKHKRAVVLQFLLGLVVCHCKRCRVRLATVRWLLASMHVYNLNRHPMSRCTRTTIWTLRCHLCRQCQTSATAWRYLEAAGGGLECSRQTSAAV